MNSLLSSHIVGGKWFKIKCCYCDTEESIFTEFKKHHGSVRYYAGNTRLTQVIDFTKKHYARIQNDLAEQLKERNDTSAFWHNRAMDEPDVPNCAKLMTETHLDKPFKIIDEENKEYSFNPTDKEFKEELKILKRRLKPIKL